MLTVRVDNNVVQLFIVLRLRKKTLVEKITANAKKMKALNVKQVSPSHSKPSHDNVFKEVFGTGYVPAILGKKVPLEPFPK